jgi:hypothetical protein
MCTEKLETYETSRHHKCFKSKGVNLMKNISLSISSFCLSSLTIIGVEYHKIVKISNLLAGSSLKC